MEFWFSKHSSKEMLPIVPDGCRDFILKISPGKRAAFFVSNLMPTTNLVEAYPGEEFFGVRLQPWTIIDWDIIKKINNPQTPDELRRIASESSSLNLSLSDGLKCLAISSSSSQAADELGVSLRTLQRNIKKHTGETPEFWRRLARARKSAKLLLKGNSILDVTYNCSYTDQSHLTRELKLWFGISPKFIQKNKENKNHWTQQFLLKGYDTPETGEQISIKKPFLSVT